MAVENGLGICNGVAWIIFSKTNAGSEGIDNKTYATALAAFSSGAKVNIYDYHDQDNCQHAESIQLVK